MKKIFTITLLLASAFLGTLAQAKEEKTKTAHKHETAAEIAEKTRVSVRNAGIKAGHAVDEFLKKKPVKKEADKKTK